MRTLLTPLAQRTISVGLILMVALGLGVAACSGETTTTTGPSQQSSTTVGPSETAVSSTAGTPKRGGTLRMVTSAAPSQLGWPAGGSPGDQQATHYCLETLLRGGPQGSYHPWLAESYEVAPDYASVTFRIRQGVKFHDGSDLTGEVVKWNLEQQKATGGHPTWGSIELIDSQTVRVNFQPATAAAAGAPPGASPPAGAPPAGAAPPSGAVPVEPAAGGTGWTNTALQDFSDSPNCNGIVSKAAYDAHGVEWMKVNPIGTGPFKFDSFQRDVSLKFVRNENYWVKGKPHLDGIEILFVSDPMTRQMMVQKGDCDMAWVMEAKEASDYQALGMQILTSQIGVAALIPDSGNADSPWSKKVFREAVEYAIDKESIAKSFGYGFLEAPYQLLPDDYPGHVSGITPRVYDPERAKQLVAEAGLTPPVRTKLIAGPYGVPRDVMVAIASDLAKVGVEAELEFPDFGKFATYLYGSWHNGAIVTGLPADANYNTDLAFYDTWSPSWARLAEYAQAVAASLSSPEPDPRLMQAAASIIISENLIIPVMQSMMGMAVRPYVMDTGAGARGIGAYWNAEDCWLSI